MVLLKTQVCAATIHLGWDLTIHTLAMGPSWCEYCLVIPYAWRFEHRHGNLSMLPILSPSLH